MNAMDLLKREIEVNRIQRKTVVVKRGEFLKQQHSKDTNLYLIKSGSLRVYTIIKDVEHCLYFGYKGSAITAVDSFFGEKESNYIIQAIKKTEVDIVQKEAFMNFINSKKEYLKLWQAILVEIIEHHVERGQDLIEASSVNRLNRLKRRTPELFQEIPHKYIASYLRMSPETLSRLQKS